MKKAFTMLELVFVIAIVGILSVMIAPNFQGNNLRQAADQVVSHIRYTQHLAMMDNKFEPSEATWFLGRWQIRFFEDLTFTTVLPPANSYSSIWAYSIYSDSTGYTGLPNISEMAIDPLNPEAYLSGGYNNTLHVEDKKTNKNMRLGEEYGVTSIAFSGGCRSNVKYISFDHLGRPFNSFPANTPYEIGSPGWHKLLTSKCNITLADGNDIITITIEPETGYVHIL